MTELRVVFMKDLRRLRWLLAVWLVAIVSRTVAQSQIADVQLVGPVAQVAAMQSVVLLLSLIELLMPVLLVSRLVHDEPLVNADAFWLTRPIRPTQLMLTKLAFAAVALVAAPAVAQALTVMWITRDAATALTAMASFAVGHAIWAVTLMAIATLTPSTIRFLVALVGLVAAIVFSLSVVVGWLTWRVGTESPIDTMVGDSTSDVLALLLVLIVAAAVMASQYRTRRLVRSIVVGGAVAALGALLVAVWPWRFGKEPEPDPGAWTRDTTRVAAVLDREATPYITDAYTLSGRINDRKMIAAPIEVTGIPPTYGTAMVVRARLAFPDTAIESAQRMDLGVPRSTRTSRNDLNAPLRAALAPAVPLRPWTEFSEQWPVVLMVNSEQLARRRGEPGRLTAAVTALLLETRVAGSMPLAEGATVRAGRARFEVRRVLARADSCSVLVRRVGPAPNSAWNHFQFVLRNVARGQFVTGQAETSGSSNLPLVGAYFGVESSNGAFADMILRYPPRGMRSSEGEEGDFDADWLRGAEMVVVETDYRGRLSRTLTVDGFVMKR